MNADNVLSTLDPYARSDGRAETRMVTAPVYPR
jgi:hypothetical protein